MRLSGFDGNVNNCIYVNGLRTHCEAEIEFHISIDLSINGSIDRSIDQERIWIEVFDLIFF